MLKFSETADPISRDHQHSSRTSQRLHSDDEDTGDEDANRKKRELSEQERLEIIRSDSFSKFVNRSTRVMERLLNSSNDKFLFTDYKTALSQIRKGSIAGSSSTGFSDDDLISVQARIRLDDADQEQMLVSSLNWSPHFNELLLASFSGGRQSTVNIWNVHCPSGSPEFRFHCPSEVTCARFSPFQPYLIIGGTYCGQLVVWDTRASRSTPVQRTVPSQNAHSHPIHRHPSNFSLTAFELLRDPNANVNGDCQFVIGSEEYALHIGHLRAEQLNPSDSLAHNGPITALHSHPRSPNYVLSSALDWTIKLWDLNAMSLCYSFEDASGSKQSGYGNLVFDVKWSPSNFGLFASGNSFGKICLWELIDPDNVDVPRASLDLNEEGVVMAVNRIEWHRMGNLLAAGTDRGQVVLTKVDERLAQSQLPNGVDCWTHVTSVLKDFKLNNGNAFTNVAS
ncbi:hypothetical protein ACOME3_003489 [Neoechinorhynchus agilis]